MADFSFIVFIALVLIFSILISSLELLIFIKLPKLLEKDILIIIFFVLGIILTFFSISRENLLITGPLAMLSFGLLCIFNSSTFFALGKGYPMHDFNINKISTKKGLSSDQISWFLAACLTNSFPAYVIAALISPILLLL